MFSCDIILLLNIFPLHLKIRSYCLFEELKKINEQLNYNIFYVVLNYMLVSKLTRTYIFPKSYEIHPKSSEPKPKNNFDEGSKVMVRNGVDLISEGVRYIVCCVGLVLSLNMPLSFNLRHVKKIDT